MHPWEDVLHAITRRGNSLEDLRLSVKGWELGREIALGTIKTNDELANWIAQNIAQGTAR